MSARVETYHWDYGTPYEQPGVKITNDWDGMHRYLFIHDNDILAVATALADILQEKNR